MHPIIKHPCRLFALLILVVLSGSLALAQQIQLVTETDTYRLLRHAAGETQVPRQPQRIVTLQAAITDNLLALDIIPVGATTNGGAFLGYFAPMLDGTAPVGEQREVNLEAILALEPDVIIGWIERQSDIYPQLSSIAPTVLLSDPRDTRDALVSIGLIVDQDARARARLEAYEARLAEARQRLSEAIGDASVAFVRLTEREFRIYGDQETIGPTLYEDLALTPAGLVPLGEFFVSVSLEVLPELDADHIFHTEESSERIAEAEGTGLWQAIPAVQAGNVYTVRRDIWSRGQGVLAKELIVDDVLASLASHLDD